MVAAAYMVAESIVFLVWWIKPSADSKLPLYLTQLYFCESQRVEIDICLGRQLIRLAVSIVAWLLLVC